jgi:hypothetical protein
VGVGKYLQTAFLNRWNLLLFLGGLGLAFLSGQPDIFCPLVLAAEVAYLGLLGMHPRFQKYVEAQAAQTVRQQGSVSAEHTVQRILSALPETSVQRFEALRTRCKDFQRIAAELKDPSQVGTPPLEALQLAGLDRLLWIYLRLLFTQYALEQFLRQTSAAQIQEDISNATRRLEGLPTATGDARRQKLRHVLTDNLETSQMRLANFHKARENYELVQLEIDRLENKIHSLSELAVNRHEPDFISVQVDQVVAGMVQTERTIGELRFLTGLETPEEVVPELLRRDITPIKH